MYQENLKIRLKQARKRLNLTQEELAEMIDIPRSTYATYEIGAAYPNLEMLCIIAYNLETSTDWLLSYSNPRKSEPLPFEENKKS